MKKIILCSLLLIASAAMTSCTADEIPVPQDQMADDTGGQQSIPPPPPPPPGTGGGKTL